MRYGNVVKLEKKMSKIESIFSHVFSDILCINKQDLYHDLFSSSILIFDNVISELKGRDHDFLGLLVLGAVYIRKDR